MFNSCLRCCRLFSREVPRWQAHLQAFCIAQGQKCAWSRMLLDNFDLIRQQSTISKTMQLQVRSTNIASQIVKTITKHYQAEDNPFRVCVQLFGSYLKVKYGDKVNPSLQALVRIEKEYDQFSRLLGDLFVLYYGLEERQIIGEDIFYKVTLPSLVSGLLFQNKDIVTTLTTTVRGAYRPQTQKISYHIEKMHNFGIQKYAPSIDLRLNHQTLEMFKVTGSGDESSYRGVVQVLLEVIRVTNPAQKMQLIEGLQKQVERSVMQFYKKHGIRVKGTQINRHDLQAILLYAIVQSSQANTYVHFQIAHHFSSPRTHKNNESLECLKSAFTQLERGSSAPEYPTRIADEESFSKSYFDEVSSTLDF